METHFSRLTYTVYSHLSFPPLGTTPSVRGIRIVLNPLRKKVGKGRKQAREKEHKENL